MTYGGSMSTTAPGKYGHAVIAGASIGGLLAARAVSDSFERVTIIDRDELPTHPVVRRGVPQSRMVHGLNASGKVALDGLFPGLIEELATIGVPIGDALSDLHWYIDGRLMKPAHSGVPLVCISRPLLEFALRSRVAALPGVTIIGHHDVIGLTTTPDRSAVTGVRLQSRGAARTLSAMPADLVVDAVGRGTGSSSWLGELGYAPAAEETIRVGIAYSCRLYHRERRALGGRLGTIAAAYPGHPAGGLVLAQEGGRFILGLSGRRNALPPTDPKGMAAYADMLPSADLAEIIRTAIPLGEPATMRFPASVRRRYEHLGDSLGGFLATGDALCSFNPVYGQGMAVAAVEAQRLLSLLRDGRENIAPRFFSAAAEVIDGPWGMMLGNDLRFPDVDGPRTPETERAREYMDAFRAAAADDTVLATALVRVLNMMDAPSRLRDPDLRERVAAKAPALRPPA